MLIKCSECGNEVSDKAMYCIYCGCPIEVVKKTLEEQRVLNRSTALRLVDYVDADKVLHIPDDVEVIDENIPWPTIFRNKEFKSIVVGTKVKEIASLAFMRLGGNVAVYIKGESVGKEKGIYFKRSITVYINYKNTGLHDALEKRGKKYYLYDSENDEIIPYTERGGWNAIKETQEKVFYAPFLTDADKQILNNKLMNTHGYVSFPKSVRMLLRGDIAWEVLEKSCEERYALTLDWKDKPPFHASIVFGEDLVYIDSDFFTLDDPETVITLSNSEEDEEDIFFDPVRSVSAYCIDGTYAGTRLLELGVYVYFKNADGYDTLQLSQSMESPRYVWTENNTRLEIQRMIEEGENLDKNGFPTCLRIPDQYTEIGYSALDTKESDNRNREALLRTVYFGKRMHLTMNDISEMDGTIKELYIPFTCCVDEEAFYQIGRRITVYCEEGSSAEKAARMANKRVVYYDFEKQKEYQKGERSLRIFETSVEELHSAFMQNPESSSAIFRILFGKNTVLVVKRGDDLQKNYDIRMVLNNCEIEVIWT